MCRNGNVSPEEMFRTFNCGIGMVAFVEADQADDICFQLAALGETTFVIGEVVAKSGDEPGVEIDCEANF
jgi:phosphoribosylformylglycinamidine cyclo-ligase